MRKWLRSINIIVFCSWLVLISVLLYREYWAAPFTGAEGIQGVIESNTRWFDIYVGNKKTGVAHTTIEKVGEEIIITHVRELQARKDGRDTVAIEKLKCLCDLSYSIKSFEYASHLKDEKGILVKGEVEPDMILFFLESPDRRKTYKVPNPGTKFYLPISVIPALHSLKPPLNKAFEVPVLNFISFTVESTRAILEEIRPLKVRIHVLSLFKYRVGESILWINDNGEIVKEETPQGLVLYSQAEYIAKDPSDRMIIDQTSLPFFQADRQIVNTEELSTVKVRVQGYELNDRLYENTSITHVDNTLTIKRKDPEFMEQNTYSLPLNSDVLLKYLQPDSWVKSDHKTVKGNALNMSEVEKNDAFRMARYLTSNLYFTVSPRPMFTLSDSLDIFNTHAGDYLERSVMFASFARAVGLPTRIVGGLVYRDGYFYYHAWPEVWFDLWIPVDPSLAQFPADATHIPLVEGTQKDIISIIDSLKTIKIEILEAS